MCHALPKVHRTFGSSITTDPDANPRFVDFTGRGTAIVDMGAYEVQRPLPFRVYLPLVMRNR